MGNQIIALTGNTNSFLAKESDIVLDVSVEKEACPNNLAPTTSTTAQLIMGDAIAISLLELKNFSKNDFARFHPGGSLGKRLNLFLNDILEKDNIPKVDELAKINDVIIEISHKRLGATAVMKNNKLCGIITDGDLRRMLEKYDDFSLLKAKDIMTSNPITISSNRLAYDALQVMEDNNINQIILLKEDNYIGIIHIHEILRQGVI
jgi:arabinose-5-phosphate isomerase